MKQKCTKVICLLLCISLLLSLFSFSIFAKETSVEYKTVAESDFIYTQDDLEAMFLDKILYGEQTRPSLFANHGNEILSGDELRIYQNFNMFIENLAMNGGSAIFDIQQDDPYLLNMPGKSEDERVSNLLKSFNKIYNHAVSDHPENFYWRNYSNNRIYTYSLTPFTYKHSGQIAMAKINLSIDSQYRDKDLHTDSTPYIDSKKVHRIIEAKDNAKKIASTIASYSCTDMEKLYMIKDKICDFVSYDENVSNATTNDLWQIIHTFDDNPNTNIVCEGYAKSFQYLCDLVFPYNEPSCYCVSGPMNGVGHMWNVVVLAGESYFVDVTNCDSGTAGCGFDSNGNSIPGDRLFMLNMKDAGRVIPNTNNDGYSISTGSQTITYIYNQDTLNLYTDIGQLTSDSPISLEVKNKTYVDFDFNEDGTFSLHDYNGLVKYITTGSAEPSQRAFYAADKNRDNALDAFDIALMKQNLHEN